jgi:hypothetical protein
MTPPVEKTSANNFPGTSLSLLFLTYAMFGWYWCVYVTAPQESAFLQKCFWGLLIVGVVFVAAFMTGPLHFLRTAILKWFKSDVRSFSTLVLTAFFAVVVFVHVAMLAHALLLLSAMSLARLDLQTHDVGEWQAFWILSGITLLGLGLGGVSYWQWILHSAT